MSAPESEISRSRAFDCSSPASARVSLAALGESVPELGRYGSEPPQMASGATGKSGYLRMRFAFDPRLGRTVLVDLDRRVPLLAQKALYWEGSQPDMACVITISTTGCVVQGDRLALDVHMGEGAHALVTTQSATKIHCMEHNYAAQMQQFDLEEGSYLEYMPDPVILHRTARYAQHTRVTIPESACFLYGEIVVPGRRYHRSDELFGFDVYAASLSAARPGGKRLFDDRFVLEPECMNIRSAGCMGGFDVFGNVFVLLPERHVKPLKDHVGADVSEELAWGALELPHGAGLAFKVLGHTSESVAAKVREFHSLVREAVLGRPLPADFLWH